MKKMKVGCILLLVLLLTGCADSVTFIDAMEMDPVGFFYGFWHGGIATIAFICSWFMDDVAVYAIYNNGGWYDFGFLWGVGAFMGGSYSKCKKK